VDKVRRQEHKEWMAQGDETLKGTRQLWLYNPQNFSVDQAEEFSALKDLQLKVARAWAAKELFSKFWEYQEEGWARRFFKDWFGWVSRSRLNLCETITFGPVLHVFASGMRRIQD
jgi:transposase